jgi:glycosyltransferase involved in cell wall biosynthesis
MGNSTKRLWVVSELYYPEETSTGYYLTKIAEGLTGSFEVKVLCGQPNYFKRGVRAPAREKHNKADIYRCAGTTLDKNVIAFRLINMLTLGITVFFKALFNFRKNDVVLVVTTPPSMPLIVAIVSRLRGAKYVPLIHDNYPELAIAAGKLKTDSLVSRLTRSVNGWLYKHASKIIVVGRDMKELVSKKLAKKIGSKNIPIAVIPNWAETEDLEPKSRAENKLLKESGLADKFVFLYAGNMGHPNDMESIVACAEKLKDDKRFHFLFLGSGAKRKWLETEVEQKNLTNVTPLAPRPRTEQNDFLNACDVAVISLVPGMWGVSMPSRTYNTLAVGKPILALTEAGSELALVVEEDRVGWAVEPNQPEKLLEMILAVFEKREEFEEMRKRAHNAALQKYSLNTALERYREELSDCV